MPSLDSGHDLLVTSGAVRSVLDLFTGVLVAETQFYLGAIVLVSAEFDHAIEMEESIFLLVDLLN